MGLSVGERENKMNRSSHYRKRAEECVELARTARTAEHRVMLMHIAETWLRLAEDLPAANGETHPAVPK